MDGIACASLAKSTYTDAKLIFVSNAKEAEKKIEEIPDGAKILVADIGLTQSLRNLMVFKSSFSDITYIDHHLTSAPLAKTMDSHVETIVEPAPSAASLVQKHMRLYDDVRHYTIVDIADYIDWGVLSQATAADGRKSEIDSPSIEDTVINGTLLNLAWRFSPEDNLFRRELVDYLVAGKLPTDKKMPFERTDRMTNEIFDRAKVARIRYGAALEELKEKVAERDGILIHRESNSDANLAGFGASLLRDLAEETGAKGVASIMDKGPEAIIMLRYVGESTEIDLGRFAKTEATRFGLEGGGHQRSASLNVPLTEVRFITWLFSEYVKFYEGKSDYNPLAKPMQPILVPKKREASEVPIQYSEPRPERRPPRQSPTEQRMNRRERKVRAGLLPEMPIYEERTIQDPDHPQEYHFKPTRVRTPKVRTLDEEYLSRITSVVEQSNGGLTMEGIRSLLRSSKSTARYHVRYLMDEGILAHGDACEETGKILFVMAPQQTEMYHGILEKSSVSVRKGSRTGKSRWRKILRGSFNRENQGTSSAVPTLHEELYAFARTSS